MRFRDYLALAMRSLRRSRLRTGLTVAAIVVGSTGLTVMLTFVTSVKNVIEDQFTQSGQIRQIQVALGSDLRFDPSGKAFNGGGPTPGGTSTTDATSAIASLTPAVETTIAAIPHVSRVAAVSTAASMTQTIQFVSIGEHRASANHIVGYETNGVIKPLLLAGKELGASDASGVVLVTRDYADALGFQHRYSKMVGQRIDLHTYNGYTGVGVTLPNVLPPQVQCQALAAGGPPPCRGGPTSGMPAMVIPAHVAGVVDPSYGENTLYMPLSWMIAVSNQSVPVNVRYSAPQPGQPSTSGPPSGQGTVLGGWTRPETAKFIADSGGYESFLVEVDAVDHVEGVAKQIDALGVSTATGLRELQEQKDNANIVGAVLGGLGLVALGIAALGVMNTMVMSVLERTREIGVMRAVGARRSTIRRLFTFEAAALGFFGGVFGVIIGYGFVLAAQRIISDAVESGPALNASFTVPVWLIAAVIIVTTTIGLASGFLPARRAAHLDPIEALRYE